MEFRILGPLEIAENGRMLALGTGRQLALVALLLVHRNEVVSGDRIVEQLWGESSPPTAAKIVRNSVSLLRKELGDRLVTRSPGYLLRVEPGELDAERLEHAVADGGLQALIEGLALWRGSPLAQVAYSDFARTEIARLEELHLTAIEARIDAELALGEHARLVPELEALVRANPLREHLRAQLMLALYRSGRQADALEAYREARRTLDGEVGLEPGRELQELERSILNQDDALDLPAAGASTVTARRRRGGLLVAAGAALLLAGGVAAGALALTSGSETKGLAHVVPNSVGVIDPKSNRIVAQIPVGATPTRLVLTDDSLWVLNSEDGSVSRIDPDRRVVVRNIAIPGSGAGLGADATGAWALYAPTRGEGGVGAANAAFIDARFNDVTRTVSLHQLFDGSDDFVFGAGSLWAVDGGYVTRLDPATGKILATIRVGSQGTAGYEATSDIAFGEGAVWAIGSADVVRIDPATNGIVATIPISQNPTGTPPNPTALAVGEGSLWVASRAVSFTSSTLHRPNALRGTVFRIDPKTNSIAATVRVGADPFGIAVGEGAVWVSNRRGFSITRIDPKSNQVVRAVPVGNRPYGVTAGQGAVWVSVG
jgi:YVTN family beta-propeller protein